MKAPVRYRIFRFLTRAIMKLYYLSVESYGEHFIPKRGRTLFIGNHQAGLIDGILIVGSLEQVIRSVVKHTLWKEPVVGFFADGLGMIPVYRKQDLSADEISSTTSQERNKKSFGAVEKAFLAGESCLIFPEGISHDMPQLQTLKSGAARMLLETEAAHDFRLGLQWLPVSIGLEVKDRPGFRALLDYHPPRDILKYRDAFQKDPEKAVHDLRDEMQSYLEEITLNFSSWEDREFLEHLTDIWLAKAPADQLLDRNNQLIKWKRILESTITADEEIKEWDNLRLKVDELTTSLETVGIKPKEVFERQKEGRTKLFAKTSFKMTLWGPLFTYGMIYWWMPLWLVKFASNKGSGGHRDVKSTYHIVAAFVFFPLWLLVTGVICDVTLGQTITTGMLVVSVSSGLSLLTSARKIRVTFRSLINMYRYNGLEEFLDDTEREICQVWAQAARLWNLALKKQIDLSDLG